MTTAEIVEELRAKLGTIPAIRATPRVFGGLVRGTGQSLQVVLGGPDYAELAGWRDRMLARMAENPGLAGRGLRLQGDAAADARRHQLRPRRGSRRLDRGDRHDAGDDDGLAAGHDLRRGRRGVRRRAAGRPPGPHGAGRAREHLRAFGPQRRAGAAVLPGDADRARGARKLQPLQPPARDHAVREPRARATRSARRSSGCERTAAEELPDYAQVDYKGAAREYRTAGGAVLFTFAMALAHRLPGARGPVRELHPPARHHADGPARGARRADRARARRAAR